MFLQSNFYDKFWFSMQSRKMTKLATSVVLKGMFLSPSVIGILGNFSLLHYYLFQSHSKRTLRPTELILKHLCVANCLVIILEGIPQTIGAFGMRHFADDFGCLFILYGQRVGRGVSIGTICLLSVFQTITISPIHSCWKDIKVRAPRYIRISISLCWILCSMVNLILTLHDLCVSGQWSSGNITKRRDMGYCSIVDHGTIMGSVYIVLVTCPEISFSVLTTWCSGSMVFILHRHMQRVQYIHSSNVPSRSPEARATRGILLLVSTFLSFYMVSSLFRVCIAFYINLSVGLVRTSQVLSLCFPTVSPFLLMSQDSAVSKACFVWIKNTKCTVVTRNV